MYGLHRSRFRSARDALPSQDFLNAPPGVPDYRSVMEQRCERTAAILTCGARTAHICFCVLRHNGGDGGNVSLMVCCIRIATLSAGVGLELT